MQNTESCRKPRIILTGDRGIGKTTACERTVRILRRRQVRCGGILTKKILDEQGSIQGIQVLDILSDPPRECLLARTDQDLGGPSTGRYRFFPEGLCFGNEALESGAVNANVLFVDEMGPLELRGEGFKDIPALIQFSKTPAIVVVVRKELATAVQKRFGHVDLDCLEITACNRDSLPQRLAELVCGK